MTILYKLVTLLAYLVMYPWGRFKASSGNKKWQGRLGLDVLTGPVDIWIHAASVGEVRVIGILADLLLHADPSLTIHVTVMTPTGFRTAESLFGDQVTPSFLPLDVSHVARRTMERLQPQMIVVAETEIWPNLIMEAGRRKVPIVLVNGRMSEKSFGTYRLFRGSLRGLFLKYDRFFFKTDEDFARYRYFGVTAEKSAVVGDMKFDAPLAEKTPEKVAEIRACAGMTGESFLFVAGSTRPGEEEILIGLVKALKESHPGLRLMMAPRHLERIDGICRLIEEAGLTWTLYDGQSPIEASGSSTVILANRMGLLNDLYLAADLAFVGGTMVAIGGHNVLEPVWAGTPVLFGKSLDNVTEAADYIVSHDFGAMANSAGHLQNLVADIMAGKRVFAAKHDTVRDDSTAALVCNYILDRIDHV